MLRYLDVEQADDTVRYFLGFGEAIFIFDHELCSGVMREWEGAGGCRVEWRWLQAWVAR